MTSITDEQLADIEAYAAKVNVRGRADALISIDELRGILARLRAAEKDAERYRWLQEQVAITNGMSTEFRFDGSRFSSLDDAIDTAMQGELK